MKTLQLYPILFLAFLLIQCKAKTDKTDQSNSESEEQIGNPDDDGTITVTVYDYKANETMRDVLITIEKAGVTLGQDTTDAQGSATLTSVDRKNQYTFAREGFTTQIIRFVDYAGFNDLNVYMKADEGLNPNEMNIRGKVYNSDNMAIENATVRSDKDSTKTQADGSYSLDINSLDGVFPLNYYKGSTNGSMRMKVKDDTVIVDVFIDGFTNDSIYIKKDM